MEPFLLLVWIDVLRLATLSLTVSICLARSFTCLLSGLMYLGRFCVLSFLTLESLYSIVIFFAVLDSCAMDFGMFLSASPGPAFLVFEGDAVTEVALRCIEGIMPVVEELLDCASVGSFTRLPACCSLCWSFLRHAWSGFLIFDSSRAFVAAVSWRSTGSSICTD